MFTNRSTTGRTTLSATVTIGALTVLTACAGAGDTTSALTEATGAPGVLSATTARPGASFGNADVGFAQTMIPHHRQAVEMAGLTGRRASDPEVRRIAQGIGAAQDPEIATMTGWLSAWGKPVTPGGSHAGHDMPGMVTEADMAGLRKARGGKFDRMFLRLMIAHHRGAIEMAGTELAEGVNPEARRLAQTIKDTQRAEIRRMRELLDRL